MTITGGYPLHVITVETQLLATHLKKAFDDSELDGLAEEEPCRACLQTGAQRLDPSLLHHLKKKQNIQARG